MSFTTTFPPQSSNTASQAAPRVAITDTAPRWDAQARDIVLGPDGEPVMGNPWESLADEVVMGLLARRGRYPEFPPDFGNTFDLDARQPSRSLVQAAFRADLTSQLPYRGDPTIIGVSQLTFDWQGGDSVAIGCTITPTIGPPVPVTIPWRQQP